MLIVLMSVWNEAPGLARAIESVHAVADRIIVADGAYDEFPHQGQRASTDGTREIAARYPKVTWWEAGHYKTQVEKRSRLLRELLPGSTGLVLDGDEWVANPEALEPALRGEWDVGWIEVCSSLYPDPYLSPRLWRYQPGLHYAGRHYWVYDGRKRLVASHLHTTETYRHADLPLRLFNFRRDDRESSKKTFRQTRKATEGRYKNELAVYREKVELQPHPRHCSSSAKAWEVLERADAPDYSLVCPMSRPWAVDPWFDRFGLVELPERTELLLIVDHDSSDMLAHVRRRLRGLQSRFCGVKLLFQDRTPPGDRDRVAVRRERICQNWHRFLCEAQGHTILGAEDDTLPDVDAYPRLLDVMRARQAGFVQGTEVGRWDAAIVSHWVLTELAGETLRIESGEWYGQDVVPINGGGWYLFAARADLMRRVRLEPESPLPVGPDVRHVQELARLAPCYGVWSIGAEHFGPDFSLRLETAKLQRAEYRRIPAGWSQRFLPTERPPRLRPHGPARAAQPERQAVLLPAGCSACGAQQGHEPGCWIARRLGRTR